MLKITKTDLTDKKILSALDKNARESNSLIAKQLKLSKNVINYRIHQLEQEGIIKRYKTVIDFSKINKTIIRIYLNLYEFHPEKEGELIEYLNHLKTTTFVAKTVGNWDLLIYFQVESFLQFTEQWSLVLDKFRFIIKEYHTGVIIKELFFRKAYLLGEKQDTSTIFWERGKSIPQVIDLVDHTILDLLSQNARLPIIELAKAVKLGSMAVIYRIKQLQSRQIILGYRAEIDFLKTGYEYYKVDLELEDTKIIKELVHHCQAHPHITAITHTIGDNIDFEFDVEIENFEIFLQFMDHLKKLFPRAIRDYQYLKYLNILKNY